MNIEDIHTHLLVIKKLLDELPTINNKQTGGKNDLSDTSNESSKESEKTKSDSIESPPKPEVNDPDYSISIMEMI